MPFTVTPKDASSRASEKVSEVSAPLDAVYAVPAVRPPVLAASEQVLTMRPQRRAFMPGMTCARQVERAVEVDREHLAPFLRRGGLGLVVGEDAGVVDQDVDRGRSACTAFSTAAGSVMSQCTHSPAQALHVQREDRAGRPRQEARTTARAHGAGGAGDDGGLALSAQFSSAVFLPSESPCAEGYQRDEQQVHGEQRPLGGVGAGERRPRCRPGCRRAPRPRSCRRRRAR